jgi:hypothetical protein
MIRNAFLSSSRAKAVKNTVFLGLSASLLLIGSGEGVRKDLDRVGGASYIFKRQLCEELRDELLRSFSLSLSLPKYMTPAIIIPL